jgi:hypothetical protein
MFSLHCHQESINVPGNVLLSALIFKGVRGGLKVVNECEEMLSLSQSRFIGTRSIAKRTGMIRTATLQGPAARHGGFAASPDRRKMIFTCGGVLAAAARWTGAFLRREGFEL